MLSHEIYHNIAAVMFYRRIKSFIGQLHRAVTVNTPANSGHSVDPSGKDQI